MTDKQELFAQLVVRYGNQSKAYREAYDVGEDTKYSTVNVDSSKLMTDPNIILRVKEIREEHSVKHGVDTGWLIQNLKDVIEDVNYTIDLAKLKSGDSKEVKKFYMMKEVNTSTDKLRAIDMLSKLLGLNQPEKIDVTIKEFKTNWGGK